MPQEVLNVHDGYRNPFWLSVLGGAAVLLIVAAHSIHDVHEGMPWRHAVLPSIPIVLEVFALSVGNTYLRRRGLKTGAMLGLGITTSAIFGCMIAALHSWSSLSFTGMLLTGVTLGMVIYGLWFIIFRIPAILYEARIKSVEAAGIKKESELARLRSNLQPHFLLNTLNAIAGLVTIEPEESRRMLTALGDLLRDTLEEGSELRPLGEEIAWLKRYAWILETRHRGSLNFEWEIEPDTLEVALPKFLLQPLIENAAIHGALRRGQGGTVKITSRMAGDRFRIIVEDNGPGMADGTGEGLGIRLVRDRLGLVHRGATLTIDSSPGGTRATIEILAEDRR